MVVGLVGGVGGLGAFLVSLCEFLVSEVFQTGSLILN